MGPSVARRIGRRALLSGSVSLVACAAEPEGTDAPMPAGGAAGGSGGSGGSGGDGGTHGSTSYADDPCAADLVVLGAAPFVGEEPRELETLTGSGLDGRYVLDLTTLRTAADLVVPSARFYIRTATPDQLDPVAPWSVRLTGLVEVPVDVPLDELLAEARPMGVKHFECSGNTNYGGFGLQSAADWQGVPIADLLDRVALAAGATALLVIGFDQHSAPSPTSEPGASWVFPLDLLGEAFLATGMNGGPLPSDHGDPVRLVVPGWYGCCQIKWVTELRLVGDDEPATDQMVEFAERTQQPGVPALAADFVPAVAERAAVVTAVEKVERADGSLAWRVLGLTWGGDAPPDGLRLHVDGDAGSDVLFCSPTEDPRTWSLWAAWWSPPAPGRYTLALTMTDPAVPTNRLDVGYYDRVVDIDEVFASFDA